MSNKAECPICLITTSSVWLAQQEDQPCPHCGADPELCAEIRALRLRGEAAGVAAEVLDRLADTEKRLVAEQAESFRLRGLVAKAERQADQIRKILNDRPTW